MRSNYQGWGHPEEICDLSKLSLNRMETTLCHLLIFPTLLAKAVSLLRPQDLSGAAETHLKFIWGAVCDQYQSPNSILNFQNLCEEAKFKLSNDTDSKGINGIYIAINEFFSYMANFPAERYKLEYGNKLLSELIYDRVIIAPFQRDASGTIFSGIDEFAEILAETQKKILKLADAEKQFKVYTAEEFSKAQFEHKWLLDGILLSNQPAIIAGPAKSLKTSLVAELAVSIGAGTQKCMGYFANTQPQRRVGFICGESGESTMKELMDRVCKSKHISIADSNVDMCFRVPRVKDELYALTSMITEGRWDVVFLDPLYLSLLAGNDANPNASSNLHAMGTLLNDLCQTCLRQHCTPVLVHHTNKHLTGRKGEECYEPLQITDMHGAGTSEFARQWILLNRREPYQENSEIERVWFKYGGSAGHGGLWGVDIDQGRFDPVTCTRERWTIKVLNAEKAHDEGASRQIERREHKVAPERRDLEIKILESLKDSPRTKSGIATAISVNKDRRAFTSAFIQLVNSEKIIPTGNKSRGGDLFALSRLPQESE